MMVAALFGVFLLTLLLGFPVALCLALASGAYVWLAGLPLAVIPQKMFAGMDSFVLLCIPGFILAGNLMNNGGITERIIGFSNALVGSIRGGLGLANITGSMIFAGISGTAVAETASIGAVMIPGMRRAGYDTPFAAAITAAASTVGPIIPPSVPMIIVSALTGLSVGRMFLAGAIPGLLLGLGMMLTCYLLAVRRDYPRQRWAGLRTLLHEFWGAFWALLMTGIILFGIVGGYFTPTEAAICSAVYALAVGLLVYRGLRPSDLPRMVVEAAVSGASLILLVGFANVFGWILTTERIPQAVAGGVLGLTDNKYLVLLLINLILLFVGTFMETIAALIILVPPLLGVATQVGIDPIHFATLAVLNLMLGLTTPPVGVCLFVAANIGRIGVTQISKAILPFLLCNMIVLLLVSYVPAISLWLPNLLYH